MAFFEDIGKKITEVSQEAVAKTKEMTDVARLSNLLTEEERRLNYFYMVLGKQYVDMHPDDYEPALQEYIQAVKDSKAKYDEIQMQIVAAKNQVICPNCGAALERGISFCSNCGNKIEIPEPVMQAKFCPSCGQPVVSGSAFCSNCGSKF